MARCPRRGHVRVGGCPVCHGDAKPGSDARATPRGAGRREGLGPGAAAPGADHTVGQGHGGRLGPGGRAVRPGVGVAQPGRRSTAADGGVGPVGYEFGQMR